MVPGQGHLLAEGTAGVWTIESRCVQRSSLRDDRRWPHEGRMPGSVSGSENGRTYLGMVAGGIFQSGLQLHGLPSRADADG